VKLRRAALALLAAVAMVGSTGYALRQPIESATLTLADAARAWAVGHETGAARPFVLPRTGTVLLFGDSWTYGTAAAPLSGYAYLAARQLGLVADIEGVSGTGFLNPGPHREGTYAQRLAALPTSTPALVVIQGGTNDIGESWSDLPAAVGHVLDQARARFPAAQIVLFGSAPSTWPTDPRLESVDRTLAAAAQRAGIPYVSPIAEQWVTADNFAAVIDPSRYHPGTAGHAYLAARFVADLRTLAAGQFR
jgi:lysophospholipase L1-like esterase